MALSPMLEAVGAILGAGAAAAGAAKGVASAVAGVRRMRASRAQRREQMAELVSNTRALRVDVDRVLHEVQTNTGSSLKDAVRFLQAELAVERVARRNQTDLATYDLRIEPNTGRVYDVHVSPAYRHLTGLDAHEASDGGWLRSVHPDDRDRVREVAHFAQTHGTAMLAHYRLRNVLTNQTVRVEHRAQPVRVLNGDDIVGWVGIIMPAAAPPSLSMAENPRAPSPQPTGV